MIQQNTTSVQPKAIKNKISWRKSLSILIAVLSMWSTALTAKADPVTIDGILYELDLTTNQAMVTGRKYIQDCKGEIVIPGYVEYNGEKFEVTSIGDRAFYKCSWLTSVTIPNSVTFIGTRAFNYCESLKQLIIDDGETTLKLEYSGDYQKGDIFEDSPIESIYLGRNISYQSENSFYSSPFCNKQTLISLTISNSVTSIEKCLFENCTGLRTIVIPNSVVTIGAESFNGCSGITSVTIGNSVSVIYSDAFKGCTALSALKMGNSVETIGYGAFKGCTNLTSVSIPNSVTSIGSNAFEGCDGLTSIEIPNSVTSIGSNAFEGCDGLTSIVIPQSVSSMDKEVFSHCRSLRKIIFEDGETILNLCVSGNSVGFFSECPLEYVYLGRSIETASDGVFQGLPDLTTLVISNSVKSIGDWTFSKCSGLTSITLPNSLKSIGRYAFRGCDGIMSLVIPNSVETIGDEAFANCSNLTSLTIGNGVTHIGQRSFGSCESLKNLTIEDGDTTLWFYGYFSESSFLSCPLEVLYLGRELPVQSLLGGIFSHKKTLKSVTIGNSVSRISSEEFYGCSGLTSVIIGDSVSTIGSEAFKDCTALTSFKMGDSVKTIEYRAFEGCTNLTSLTIPGSATSIHYTAFNGCSSLKEISFEYGESKLQLDNLLFKDCPLETLYLNRNISPQYYLDSPFYEKQTLTKATIGSSATLIGSLVFYGCDSLKKLIIEDGETDLELGNMGDCPLNTLYLGRNITGQYFTGSFQGCNTLTELTISNSVTKIGASAFSGCVGITSLTIPESVTIIGSRAFENCSGIKILKIPYVTTVEEGVFSGCDNLSDIHIHHGVKGFELSGLNKNLPVIITPDMRNGFEGISESQIFRYLNDVVADYNNRLYGVIKAAPQLNVSNCVFRENDIAFVDLDHNGNVISDVDNLQVLYRGEDVTSEILSKAGFSYTPTHNFKDNTFDTFGGDGHCKDITMSSAGSLFDIIGLSDIEKVEVLKLSGDINGTDVLTINRMSSLKWLDLDKTRIVEGGVTYRDNFKTSNNTIGSYFFKDINLVYLKLPDSAQTINADAFNGMLSLKTIDFGSSVKKIGENAFTGCKNLSSVTIPNTITAIGKGAFTDCGIIKSLIIPNSVKSIGDNAFLNCTSLEYLTIEDGNSELAFGNWTFEGCPLKALYLGRNITNNFSVFPTLESVTIGNRVTSIIGNAFSLCYGLKSLTIPNNVKTIGYEAFKGCSGLTELHIGSSVNVIEAGAFTDCTGIREVELPYNLQSLGRNAFEGCSSLISVSLNDRLSEIGAGAFKETAIEKIIIPTRVSSIGNSSFKDCVNLSEVHFSENISNIGSNAFQNTAISELILPERLSKVGEYAFDGCENLMKITSLNTTPPSIDTTTFSSETEACVTLQVRKGSLVYYWIDPVWKEFQNMTDNLLYLGALPDANYGDDEIDLALYAPDDVAIVYESSNNDVVRIEGSKMRIVGAGEATVGALIAEEGTPMELIGQMRQINVNKADLIVTAADITINEGDEIPDFNLVFEGLVYDDTPDDIDQLPEAYCDATKDSPMGEYPILFTEGRDRNYNISTVNAKLTISKRVGVEMVANPSEERIQVFTINGVLIYDGPRKDISLEKGLYIIVKGDISRKLYVK